MPETVIAIDFGLRRMGLAVGQTISQTASPLGAVAAKNGKPDWPSLDATVDAWRPARLLLGLPRNMDGSEGEMCGYVRRFAGTLERRYAMSVELVDERLTTVEAKRLSSQGDDHAVAAGLIAETWLNG